MKNKLTLIALIAILTSQSMANSVLAYQYQEQNLETNSQLQQYQYQYQAPRYVPAVRKKESHPIRNTLIGISLAGVATVGFLVIGTLAAFDG